MPAAREVFCQPASPGDVQRDLEDRFFRELRMPNGTYKTTTAGRLAAFDDRIVAHLGDKSEISVLDVGVASGITTLDLAESLSRAVRRVRIVAADRYLNAKLVRLGPRVDVLLSEAGDVLQVRMGSVVRPLPQGNNKWRSALLKLGLDVMGLLAKRRSAGCEDILLTTAGLRCNEAIEITERDIERLQPDWEDRFDVVRASNVLNLSYFNRSQLEEMVGYLIRYVKNEGLIAICRSDEETGVHHGSIFVKDAGMDAMRCVDRLGDGSEISDIVSNARVVTSQGRTRDAPTRRSP